MECVKTGDNSLAFGYKECGHEEEDGCREVGVEEHGANAVFDLLQVEGYINSGGAFTRSAIIQRKRVLIRMTMITLVSGDSWRILNTGMNGVLTLIGRRRRCCSRMI